MYSKFRTLSIGLILVFCHCDGDSGGSPAITAMEVHAHRGGAALRPENSLSAFKYAVTKIGVDAIELDVRPTLDNALVINHDSEINLNICLDSGGKTINRKILISSLTFDQVRKYDCGSLVGLPKGTSLPTLDEVFTTIEQLRPYANTNPRYDLHVKWDGIKIDPSTYAQLLVTEIQNHQVVDDVNFMCDSTDILNAAYQLEPNMRLYYLVPAINESVISYASQNSINTLVVSMNSILPHQVTALHRSKMRVIAWIVNDPSEWQSLDNMGVDGILTDNPLTLKQFLNKDMNLAPNTNTSN